MIISREITKPISIKNPVVTIGSFDGVHNAHIQIIKRINDIARSINGNSVIITFHPHPRLVLNHNNNYKFNLLTTTDEKAALLEKLGLDHLIIIPFTSEFSTWSAEKFVDTILVKLIRVKKVVIGYNHKFGKGRTGDIDFLKQKGNNYGFDVELISKQAIDKVNISSTQIRNLLYNGNISNASKLLGHSYFFEGIVVKGKRIGTKINFPTANIVIDHSSKLIPKEGVYAINAIVDGKLLKGMLHIGQKPTLTDMTFTIEANLFDFSENLYGKKIKIFILEFVRNNYKFDDIQLLKEQLEKDKVKVLSILE